MRKMRLLINMRHNDARKWLHAALDLLPVILIPVFMIYSHRHTIDSGSIQVQDEISVDFNQQAKYYTGNYLNISYSTYANSVSLNGTMSSIPVYNQFPLCQNQIFKRDGSKYYIKFSNSLNLPIGVSGYGIHHSSFIWSVNASSDWDGYIFLYTTQIYTFDNALADVQIFDLTQMFGRGNEPTIEQFETMFTSDYYQYTLSDKFLIDGNLVTYDDTDIMSQFTYQMYNAVDKYFNMGNIFGMNNVYSWFELNIFGGSAPLYIYIVWQIVLYEFVMDLLFLLYGLFMWFIDICKHLMEKPFKSIK